MVWRFPENIPQRRFLFVPSWGHGEQKTDSKTDSGIFHPLNGLSKCGSEATCCNRRASELV